MSDFIKWMDASYAYTDFKILIVVDEVYCPSFAFEKSTVLTKYVLYSYSNISANLTISFDFIILAFQ